MMIKTKTKMDEKSKQQSGGVTRSKTEPQLSQQQPTVSSIACRSISVKANPTTMRMGPPPTLRNWKFHKPLLAVGNANGVVQIFNLALGKLYRELSVHSYSVRGIEWIGLNAFISYAVSESFQGNDSNWELHVTELDTGRTVQLKSGRSSENSVIKSVKASHLCQYFIIIYKNDPFEIWDLDTLSLLKRVPKQFTGIVASEWSPLYSKRIEPSSPPTNTNNPTIDQREDATSKKSSKTPLRENFVITNKIGELFHFSIAGSVVKEISKIPPETTMTKAVTAIAWKSDHVVLGRNDGNISVWDLGQKESHTVSTMRGSIKKIRFAPGRGNMKILILFDDGADIWDVRRLRLISTVILSRGQFVKVEDADWAASDRPVILTSNNNVVITDLEFKQFSATPQEAGPYRSTEMAGGQSAESCYLQ